MIKSAHWWSCHIVYMGYPYQLTNWGLSQSYLSLLFDHLLILICEPILKIEENICSKNNEKLTFDKFNIIYENL